MSKVKKFTLELMLRGAGMALRLKSSPSSVSKSEACGRAGALVKEIEKTCFNV